MTNADKLNQYSILLKDSIVSINISVDNKLSYNKDMGDSLDILYIMRGLSYAAKCGSIVYKDIQYKTIFELIDKVLVRCNNYM